MKRLMLQTQAEYPFDIIDMETKITIGRVITNIDEHVGDYFEKESSTVGQLINTIKYDPQSPNESLIANIMQSSQIADIESFRFYTGLSIDDGTQCSAFPSDRNLEEILEKHFGKDTFFCFSEDAQLRNSKHLITTSLIDKADEKIIYSPIGYFESLFIFNDLLLNTRKMKIEEIIWESIIEFPTWKSNPFLKYLGIPLRFRSWLHTTGTCEGAFGKFLPGFENGHCVIDINKTKIARQSSNDHSGLYIFNNLQ